MFTHDLVLLTQQATETLTGHFLGLGIDELVAVLEQEQAPRPVVSVEQVLRSAAIAPSFVARSRDRTVP